MPTRAVPGLALQVVHDLNAQLVRQLKMSTVFFFLRDEKSLSGKLIGTGVAADLHGTKVIFTAGHVLRDFQREFADERVALSVNRDRGSFSIGRYVSKHWSTGGDHGADAGILVLPNADANTYFNFANLAEVVRSTTIRSETPPIGLECIVAGFPSRLSSAVTRNDRPNTIEVRVTSDLLMLVADVVDVDALHLWLGAAGNPIQIDTDQQVELGSLNGMSGAGCWSVEIDEEAKELKLFLHGVHTATQSPLLRQTPILHHLRLLAEVSATAKDKIAQLWPNAVSA